MAFRRTFNDVISPGTNPTTTLNTSQPNFSNQQATFILGDTSKIDARSAAELRAQNDRMRAAIAAWKNNRPVIQEQIFQQSGLPEEFNKKIQFNAERIRDLQTQIAQQNQVMKAYENKFGQFQQNLNKLMRLDKDIHSKLVNPEHSTTLQKNVKNVMMALNSGAPYGRVLEMLNNIKV